jgi:hypothetical protein
MANEAWRGRGRLHIRCDVCSSTGSCHAQTVTTVEGKVQTEILPYCPWCGVQMNIVVKPLPEGQDFPVWS